MGRGKRIKNELEEPFWAESWNFFFSPCEAEINVSLKEKKKKHFLIIFKQKEKILE